MPWKHPPGLNTEGGGQLSRKGGSLIHPRPARPNHLVKRERDVKIEHRKKGTEEEEEETAAVKTARKGKTDTEMSTTSLPNSRYKM